VTGWFLILLLLVLGGILSTLGDRLGTRVGKARLSIFKLRPKRTAVLITVFTGSIISSISFAIMVAFNSQLRVGLFELEGIQAKISKRENELKILEKNLVALRRGDVVIKSGQSLFTKTIKIDEIDDIKKEIDIILRQANSYAFNLLKDNKSKYRIILLVPNFHIENIKEKIADKRSWVVSIKSTGNILRGENYVPAYPEVRLNKNITRKGEVIAMEKISLEGSDFELINKKIKLLLFSTLKEVKDRGSLTSELKVNPTQINNLAKNLVSRNNGDILIIAKSIDNSQSADNVSISLEIKPLDKAFKNKEK